ncbi:VirB4 family type IV secretion system protein [Actinoplanes awajinensis]|uniref:Conjugal transfer protein TraC n=1 Tax=Actinoplanes awajinensis subsp. mycoplanecinus TaxID=135947 RepID=A0A101JR35_9ACTN|nr:ATP-binding protein [Actinoplanes awajinensis]KUL31470.1 conjugal transfer protein TraC [Actinoplanes awajinensis subsp. mycoplanecinus]
MTRKRERTPPVETPASSLAAAAAPASVEVTPRFLRVGDGYAATLVVTGYPAEVGPAWLEPLLSWPGRLDLALHIDPIPAPVAAGRLRTQRARFESSRRADAAKGKLADPYVEAAADDAADLAERLARGVSKLFRVGLYLTVHARTEAELLEACSQVKAAAASTLIEVQPATWRHLSGWTTTLPLATDSLQMRRTMDTAALAAAFPLASADLPAPLPGDPASTGGVLYGINPDSQGIVWWDRWSQENYNSIVLARSGAGKSYFVKLDVLRNLFQGVRVAVVDPEDEYLRLADAVGGTIVRLGASGVKINPLDLPVGDNRPDVLTRRGLFLHTLITVLLAEAPPPGERAALDRAILQTYRQAGITADPATHHRAAPLLKDLTAVLDADGDPAATQLAARLAPWVHGSFAGLFDGPTTTRPDGHLIVWSLRQLPDELRTVGQLLALDAIWRSVDAPGRAGRSVRRLVVVDEAWLLMRDGEGAKFLFKMSKAGRKRNAGLSVITQDVADVLGTDLGQAVVANAATQVLLKQAPQAIDRVADAFGLTAGERRMLLSARVGRGLLISGPQRTAFEAISSRAEHGLATTKPSDLDDEETEL